MRTSPDLRPFRPYVSVVLCAAMVLSLFVGMISFPDPASAAEPVTVVFQDGLNGYDGTKATKVISGVANENNNYGNIPTIDVSQINGANSFSLIQFDVSSIPKDAIITNATLDLYQFAAIGQVNDAIGTVAIHKIIKDWVENSVTWKDVWNDDVALIDFYDTNPLENYKIEYKPSETSSLDITAITQQWVDESIQNYGVLLRLNDDEITANWRRTFWSDDDDDDDSNPPRGPKLTVTYTIPVPVTGVDVTPDSLSFYLGDIAEQLSANVLPADATNQNVTWSSSDINVATVDANGLVTPVGLGTATITATTEYGNFTDSSTVTVVEPNATLANLALSKGELAPAFDAGTFGYTATVTNDVYSLKVTPTVMDPNATVTVNGQPVTSGTASQEIALDVGEENEITIIVTAGDNTTTETYTINVTRLPSSNADLKSLALSSGSLNEGFDRGRTDYTATVTNSVYSLTVTADVYDPNATMTINGMPVTSSTASQNIALNVGNDNVINVIVTAQDGTTKTYTIVVTRQAPATPPTNDDDDDNPGSGGGSAPNPTKPSEPSDPPEEQPVDPEEPLEEPTVPACPLGDWTDIQNHWAKSYIETAAGLCIVNGVSSESFLPDAAATRLQFALMVARGMKLEPGNAADLNAFADRADIPEWAVDELASAVKAGIILGYGDNTLRPNEKITRAEMVTMLIRGAGISVAAGATSFADDADIPAWARGYVAKAEQLGIILGRTNNEFDPADPSTRAEAAVVAVRYFGE